MPFETITDFAPFDFSTIDGEFTDFASSIYAKVIPNEDDFGRPANVTLSDAGV